MRYIIEETKTEAGKRKIPITEDVDTHISFDDVEEELKRMEEFRKAQTEVEKKNEKPCRRKCLRQFRIF